MDKRDGLMDVAKGRGLGKNQRDRNQNRHLKYDPVRVSHAISLVFRRRHLHVRWNHRFSDIYMHPELFYIIILTCKRVASNK